LIVVTGGFDLNYGVGVFKRIGRIASPVTKQTTLSVGSNFLFLGNLTATFLTLLISELATTIRKNRG